MTSKATGDIDDTCPYELSHIYELIKAEYGAVLQQYQNTRIAQGRLEAHLECRVSPLLLRINRVTHFMTEDLEMNESQKSRILEIELELVQQLRDRRKVEADQCESHLKSADGYRKRLADMVEKTKGIIEADGERDIPPGEKDLNTYIPEIMSAYDEYVSKAHSKCLKKIAEDRQDYTQTIKKSQNRATSTEPDPEEMQDLMSAT